MKKNIKRILMTSSFLLVTTFSASAQQKFNSAEERIVYNKKKGLEKYEGVQIEYCFILNKQQFLTEVELQIFRNYFPDALNFRQEIENNQFVLYILTEGDRTNHDKYNEALNQNPQLAKRGRRNYILK